MSHYLLIETRTTWESGHVTEFLELAGALADGGNRVDLFLIQNGALMAYPKIEPRLEELIGRNGLTIWADDFSLAARSHPQDPLNGVRIGGADALIELLTQPGCKATWH